MTTALLPIEFEAPLIAPTLGGLFAATTWAEETGPTRWLASGIRVRVNNYGADASAGIWGAPWCASPDDLTADDVKTGTRSDNLAPFTALTLWAFAQSEDDDLRDPTAAEVRDRAQRTLALFEPVTIEREFAARLLTDVDTPTDKSTLVEAVAHLEEQIAATGTVGVIHARAGLLTIAEANRLIIRDPGIPSILRTPAGHRWAFGAGYAAPGALRDTLVATSALYGWRDAVQTRDTFEHEWNRYAAIAERSVIVGYEHAIGAATIAAETTP